MGDFGSGWYGQIYGNKQIAGQQANAADDLMEQQFALMQDMFPFSSDIQSFAQDLYGGGGFDEIQDYLMNPTKPTNLQRQLFEFFGGQEPSKGGGGKQYKRYGAKQSGPLAGMGMPMLEEATGWLRDLIPYGQELAETGFRTDIGPAQDYAMRLFNREMIPELAERFGPPGQGSGAQGAYGRAMGDVSSELGAMQVALDEAAAQRRLQALQSGTVQGLFTGPLDRTMQFALAGGQVGQNYQQSMDMARPGRGLLGALPAITQGATSGGFIQPGFPTSGTDMGNLFSALGQSTGSMGQLGNALADWIGGWGSGGGVGTQTGMGWDMNSMGGTDLGGQMPWLGSGTNIGVGTETSGIFDYGTMFA